MSTQNTVLEGEYKSSFGGADIQCVIGQNVVGELQAISYNVTREKGPVYTMTGTADPHSFARGKRAIAGTLVFLTIDEQAFLKHMKEFADAKFYANKRSVRYSYLDNNIEDAEDLFSINADVTLDEDDFELLTGGQGVGYERESQDAWYADQVLPFDVNLSAANEMGQAMKKSFVGVEILNEGGGVSVDDLVLAETYSYVCRGMTSWTKVLGPRQAKV